MRLFRLLKILAVGFRFGLDEFFLGHERVRGLRACINALLLLARARRAARGATAPGARSAGTDLRQVRAGALDAPRSAARRTSPTSWPSCRTRCRRSRPSRRSRCSSAPTARPLAEVFADFRPRAGRQRIGRAGALRAAARRHGGRGQGAAARHRGSHRQRPRAARRRRDADRARCGPTASACARTRSSPSSRSTSRTSSTSCAKRPTRASCGATSGIRRCCWCRRSTGTTARAR